MIQSFNRARLAYFDRNIIKRNWKRINRGPLQKAGNRVRMIARGSIRRAGPSVPPSPAGVPPRSRQHGRTPPFKQIYSWPYNFGTSVIVGMVGYGSMNPVPGLHEHGGGAKRTVFVKRRRVLKKGGLGAFMNVRVRKGVRYPRRPFMVPALRKAVPILPILWKDSLHRLI